jgi:hypothetical protein
MVPLYVLGTEIYHFVAKFFQIEQITNLQRIDSVSDHQVPLVSAEVAEIFFFGEMDMAPHVSQIKTQKISIKNNPSSPKISQPHPLRWLLPPPTKPQPRPGRRPSPVQDPSRRPCAGQDPGRRLALLAARCSYPQSSSPEIGSGGRSSRKRARG